MPEFSSFLPRLIEIRHHLHRNPELGLEEFETSELVARHLDEWGFEVTRGIAGTGVVGSYRKGQGNLTIGLRADMDALPLQEETGLPYSSTIPGRMHACGHDGHTAMLLGAAWLIAHDPGFSGCVHLIFQPAEETVGGAKLMIEDGLFDQFPCDRVFAVHNYPGLDVGRLAVRAGAMSASIDAVTVTVLGKGGHGAFPQDTVDPIVVASSIVLALQSIVARNIDPHEPSVVIVGAIHSGTVSNIIPDSATLEISMRATDPDLRIALRERVTQICQSQAESYGASVQMDWQTGYPAVINDEDATAEARLAARDLFGAEMVEVLERPMMGSEDFSFFAQKVPGAYVFLGNGNSSGLHSNKYDFNDELLEIGARFFHRIASRGD